MPAFKVGNVTLGNSANIATTGGVFLRNVAFQMGVNGMVTYGPAVPEPGPPALGPALQGQRMVVGWRAWGVRAHVTRTRAIRKTVRVPFPMNAQAWAWDPEDISPTVPTTIFDRIHERVYEYEETVPVDVEHRLVGLGATFYEYRWQPGLNVARCAAVNSPACHTPPPNPGCGCGFWAAKSFQWIPNVRPTIDGMASLGNGCRCLIVGLVGLSGDLEECEQGWRASQARVLALWRDPLVADEPHHHQDCGDRPTQYAPTTPACSDPYCRLCGGPPPQSSGAAVWERGAVHYQPLGEVYRVPVFNSRTELCRYADEHAWTPAD